MAINKTHKPTALYTFMNGALYVGTIYLHGYKYTFTNGILYRLIFNVKNNVSFMEVLI